MKLCILKDVDLEMTAEVSISSSKIKLNIEMIFSLEFPVNKTNLQFHHGALYFVKIKKGDFHHEFDRNQYIQHYVCILYFLTMI